MLHLPFLTFALGGGSLSATIVGVGSLVLFALVGVIAGPNLSKFDSEAQEDSHQSKVFQLNFLIQKIFLDFKNLSIESNYLTKTVFHQEFLTLVEFLFKFAKKILQNPLQKSLKNLDKIENCRDIKQHYRLVKLIACMIIYYKA